MRLSDVNEEYHLETKEKNNKVKHQYHDMVFKELLDDKKEFVCFMKKMGYDLEEEKIEKYNRKFNTRLVFSVRESDIIYKLGA